MKIIFDEEKEFLEKELGIHLPRDCWRDGSKIYLNIDTKPALIEFKVIDGKITTKKNNLIDITINEDEVLIQVSKGKQKLIKNLTWREEFQKRKEYLMALEQESIEKTKEYILAHPNHKKRVSISGGKDSDLMLFILNKVFKELGINNVRKRVGGVSNTFTTNNNEFIFDVFNTTNDTAQTYSHIKSDIKIGIEDIHTPEKGWYRWLSEDKNWFLPSTMVRNCCSTFKEGNLKKVLDKNTDYIIFVGMRKYESAKRSKYDWDLNEAILKQGEKKLNVPENWKRFLPIVNFKDEDVWLMLLHYRISFNDMYRLGYNRCGCIICPYASDYTDIITRNNYPLLMNRWEYALEKNYETYGIEKRLKWTLEEWKLGKWKQGTSKLYEYITKKPTKERINEVSNILGVSEELALKYFKRTCKSCDKKLNPDEIAMNLKLFGRYEGIEDNREFLCKDHICEYFGWTKDQYQGKVMEFRNGGCNLF